MVATSLAALSLRTADEPDRRSDQVRALSFDDLMAIADAGGTASPGPTARLTLDG